MSGGEQRDRTREEADRRVLTPAFRGPRAIAGLAALCARAAPRLELDARGLRRADAFTGVVVHETVRRHLEADPGHEVVLWEPADEQAWAMLHDLLTPLPRLARWAGEQPAAQRERQVLVPATPIDDDETIDLVTRYALPAATASYRIPDAPRRLLLEAAAAFADNAVLHGGGAPSVLCACYDPQANDLQLVVLSPAMPDGAGDDAATVLRDAVDRREDVSGIETLIEKARRRKIDATVRLVTGTGRLRWRGHPEPQVEETAAPVPAFVASLEIHLPART